MGWKFDWVSSHGSDFNQDFGVSFNAPLETGGLLVSDKITLELDISAIKNA